MQEAQQRIAELTADAEENVSGVRVVKAFAQEERQLERFRHTVQRVFDQQMVATRIQALYNPLISFLPNLGLAAILLFGGRQVIDGSLSLGAFTAFYAYLLMLISPMRTLGYMLGAAQRATASGARIFQVLDREPRIESAPGAPAAARRRRPGVAARRRAHLRGRDAPGADATSTSTSPPARWSRSSARWARASRRWCRCFPASTTSAPARSRSTAPTCARSTCDSLRRAIAVVNDDPFLFSATIHDNIAYARADATREEVERAAAAAQADGFIERLPDGYDTRVGERGLTLSGGQRQRIAIARAILADPRILILDDATSSVDASTEREIKRALGDVLDGRTTFVIAHRLSTISLADRIVVLEARASRRRRHPRRAAGHSPSCTARSSRRASRTRCSSPASPPSPRWRD